MKNVLLLALILALSACGTAEPEATGELTVSNVRANMTLPTDTGSIWMTIHNGTALDESLRGAEIAGCTAVELHDMHMEDDVMIMREVEGDGIPIPAGQSVELEQGGLHVMCLGKEANLEVGDSLEIILQFANTGDMPVTAEVVAPGGMSMDSDEHADMDMNMNMDHDQ